MAADKATSSFCGTTYYLAPETILDRGSGRPVDFWALGVTFFELASGRRPFAADTTKQVYDQICFGKLKFPHGKFSAEGKILLKGARVFLVLMGDLLIGCRDAAAQSQSPKTARDRQRDRRAPRTSLLLVSRLGQACRPTSISPFQALARPRRGSSVRTSGNPAGGSRRCARD